MLGLVAVEVVPSPKFQLREAIEPSLSLELSVKLTVRPLAAEAKFATAVWLPYIPTTANRRPQPATVAAYSIPVSSRAASDIMLRFHGGSNTSPASASATGGVISRFLRTSSTGASPMPPAGAGRTI